MSISNAHIGGQAPVVSAITPTQQIVAESNRIEYVTDGLGRTLGVQRINLKLRRRVLKALSDQSAEKNKYHLMALVACSCVEIDGDKLAFPASELAVDALIDRLEQEGLDAVSMTLATKFPRATKDELKNS